MTFPNTSAHGGSFSNFKKKYHVIFPVARLAKVWYKRSSRLTPSTRLVEKCQPNIRENIHQHTTPSGHTTFSMDSSKMSGVIKGLIKDSFVEGEGSSLFSFFSAVEGGPQPVLSAVKEVRHRQAL